MIVTPTPLPPQLRFFRQLCTAAKVDKVVELAQEAMAAGHCPVIGLQVGRQGRGCFGLVGGQSGRA